jgi:glycosyltransferase involved in cell wall biosynthesis
VGGERRAAAIARAYEAAGHDVTTAGLYDPWFVKPDAVGPFDVPLGGEVHARMQELDPHSEISRWRAIAEVDVVYDRFAAAARRARADLVQFEEPFCWFLARQLRADGHTAGAPIVHSSYNFETTAQHELREAGAPISDATLRDVAALERRIAAEADLVVTVSDGDAEAFRSIGARRVIVAPNGTEALSANARTAGIVARFFAHEPHALFVSSAHPPNAAGLLETVAQASGRAVLREGLLLVAGDVSRLVRASPEWRRNQHVFARTRLLGRIDDAVLAALYADARIVVLPKTKGGGSNLKTAEALVSGRPIAATRRAFEGFEAYAGEPGVYIANDGADLWQHVADALRNGAEAAPMPLRSVGGLLWPECLRPMVRAAEELAAAVRSPVAA